MLFYRWASRQSSSGDSMRDALTSEPDFVGWVTGVEPLRDRIVVESQAEKIVSRVFVRVTNDTLLFRREEGTLQPIRIAEVALQDQAQLWLTEPVSRSFPAQVTARQVIVERLY